MPRQIRRTRKPKSFARRTTPISRGALRAKKPVPLTKRFLAQTLWAQEQAELERRAIPAMQVYGTLLERVVYKALLRLGVPFDFQSSLVGGRWGWQFGRQVADFVLPQQRLIIEVQGNRWHRPLEMQARDMERELVLQAHGWTVLYLWEEVILDPLRLEQWLVENVLHSAMDTTGYFASTDPALVTIEQKRLTPGR